MVRAWGVTQHAVFVLRVRNFTEELGNAERNPQHCRSLRDGSALLLRSRTHNGK